MARHVAKVISLASGGIAGWWVFANLAELFSGAIPFIGGAGIFIVVFVLTYFPLVRPIADVISDKLAVLMVSRRHVTTGSGLEEIPETRRSNCSICGAPTGPICPECELKMVESKTRNAAHPMGSGPSAARSGH